MKNLDDLQKAYEDRRNKRAEQRKRGIKLAIAREVRLMRDIEIFIDHGFKQTKRKAIKKGRVKRGN